MKTSKLFRLNYMDVLKALLIAMLTPVIMLFEIMLTDGELAFDWKIITYAAFGGGLSYLLKNFFTTDATN